MATPNAVDTRRHSSECDCATCEANKTGFFAQRDALNGDTSAADRLSPAVYAFLATQRAARCRRGGRGESHE